MKNSFFISLLCSVFNFFADIYKASFVKRIVDAVFGFFSRKWSESAIVSCVSRDTDKAVSGSCILSKAGCIKRLYLSFGQWLCKLIRQSVSYRIFLSLSDSFIALNTRFLCVMFCSASAVYCLRVVMLGGKIYAGCVAVLVLGVVFGLFNKNLYNVICSSWTVTLFRNIFNIGFVKKESPVVDGYSLFAAVIIGIISGVAMYSSLILSLIVICGIFGLVLILRYPVFGAMVAVAVAPFVPTMPLVGFVVLVFAAYIIRAVCSCKLPSGIKNFNVALAIFIVINMVSAFVSFSALNSLQVLAVSFSMMLIYFVINGTVTDKKALHTFIKVFVISGAIVAAYGICQYFFGWGLDIKNAWIDEDMFEQATVRVYSTLENPNVLGEYLLLVAFPCLALAFHSDKFLSKLFYFALLAVICLCLIFTQSRGCWIGFLIGVFVYVTFIKGKLLSFIPLILVLLPLVLPQTILARFSSIGNLGDSSSSYRMFIWIGTVLMLKDYWFFGVGQGTKAFNIVYPSYSYSTIIAPHAHNLYLQIFAECGFVGLISFLSMCVFWFRKLVVSFRNTGRGLYKAMSVAIGAGMLAYLVQGMFDYVFYNYRVVMIFWAVIGLGMALYNTTEVSDD